MHSGCVHVMQGCAVQGLPTLMVAGCPQWGSGLKDYSTEITGFGSSLRHTSWRVAQCSPGCVAGHA
jgi:hypothetical protein